MKKRLEVITAIVLAGCLQLQAASVAIVNPSAEANTGAVPTGWTYYADGSYPGATAQTALSRPIAADDGLNIFVLYHAGLTQTLGSTYQSGFKYTMIVDVAKRSLAAGQTTGWGFGLYYDNEGTLTEIAKTQGDATWTAGTWLQKDLVLTVPAGAAYIGKDIVVRLFMSPTSETSDFLDNVRLSRDAVLPPETLTLSPANGATYVATNVNLVATFNMDIVAGNGNILITNLTDGTATTFAVGDAQVTISGATLTIDPDDDLIVNKDYAVLIETGAIENTFGGGFGITDTVTWRFTTKPTQPVAIVNPSAESNTGAAPTGWTVLAGTPTAQTAASRPIAADDGLNLFVLFNPAAISQTLGETYQSGSTYIMSVDAAKRGDTAYNTGYGFGLYYDNGGTLTEIAKTQGVANWANGTWQQKDLVLTVNAGAAYIGKAIVVKLFGAPTSGTSDFVDNVRLSRGPIILSGYDTWAASYGLTGADPAAVNNAAGINNLTAYGLGLNPTNGAAVDGALPAFGSDAGGMVYVMARRNDDPSLTFHLLTASNLVDGVWCTNNTPADYTVSGTNTVGRFDFVTHIIDTTGRTKFIKPLVAQ